MANGGSQRMLKRQSGGAERIEEEDQTVRGRREEDGFGEDRWICRGEKRQNFDGHRGEQSIAGRSWPNAIFSPLRLVVLAKSLLQKFGEG